MDQLAVELLKTFGIGGLVLLFTGWLIVMVIKHFLAKDDRKDEQILKITNSFSEALDRNSLALNELTQSEIRLTNAAENIVKGFDRAAAQNREEHGEILEFIREAGRRH